MAYTELPPPPGLEPFVACVWTSSPGPGGPVLPDGCVDVVWTGLSLVVAGPPTQVAHPVTAPEATKLGMRFRVGAAGAALGVPADELVDSAVPLAELWRGPLEPPRDLPSLVRTVARRLPSPAELDPLVRAAAVATARSEPGSRELGRALGLSERQLLRRFRRAVGYGPRTFARVVRFQRFLALAHSDPSPDLARLAADAGYADQSHLTRECRRLAGRTPLELIRAGAVAAGEKSESFNTAPARSDTLAA
ncbi:MAG: helix-turn-helix domain-containing protein [Thermoleophilaceae bacterium]